MIRAGLLLLIGFALSASAVIPIVRSSEPIQGGEVPHVSSSGYVLHSVLTHDVAEKNLHYYKTPDSVKENLKRSISKRGFSFDTTRDRVQAYVRMMEEAYPWGAITWHDPAFDEPRAKLRLEIEADFADANFTSENLFVGTRDDQNSSNTIGVQIVVYENPETNHAVLVFRGTYGTLDNYNNAIWVSDFVKHELPTVSVDIWTKVLNLSSDDLPFRTAFGSYYYWFAFDAAFPSLRSGFIDQLSEATGISKDDISLMGYFAVAQKMVDELMPELLADGKNISIVGHSQGGATAGLVSMYLWTKLKLQVETVLIAPVGGRCIAAKFADRVNIDFAADYPWITNYVIPYDLIGYIGYAPGKRCQLPWTNLDTMSACQPVMGCGVELMVDGRWGECRKRTHSIMEYYLTMMNNSNMNEDGTTTLGCETVPFTGCPTYSNPSGYGGWVFFHVVIIIAAIAIASISIFFCCRYGYLRSKGRANDPLFWCCPAYFFAETSDDIELAVTE